MAIIILEAIVLIAIVWVIATVNNFKRLEIKIDEALSGIEVALEKRYDMLTKLMDTAKGYMAHENDIFTKVVNLRKGMSVRDLITTDVQLSDIDRKSVV